VAQNITAHRPRWNHKG